MTNFAAIDCEMDFQITNEEDFDPNHTKFNVKNPGLVCKISVVNQFGEIVLDTLVDYDDKPVIKAFDKANATGSKKKILPGGTASTDSTSKNLSSGSENDEYKPGQKRTHSQRYRQPKLKEKKSETKSDFVIEI